MENKELKTLEQRVPLFRQIAAWKYGAPPSVWCSSQEEAVLPGPEECVAIAPYKEKTAALCYDRVWAALPDLVPDPIRCFAWTQRQKTLIGQIEAAVARDRGMQIMSDAWGQDGCLSHHRSTESKLVTKFVRELVDRTLVSRQLASQFSLEYRCQAAPVYESEADRTVVVAALTNLEIVDEDQLTWEQVMAFRQDAGTLRKYRRFLHWLEGMAGEPRSYVEDEIGIRLEDYDSALQKHGIRTVKGNLKWLLSGEALLSALGITGGIAALTGSPLWGLLGGSGYLVKETLFKLWDDQVELRDIEAQHRDIAWVYETGELGR